VPAYPPPDSEPRLRPLAPATTVLRDAAREVAYIAGHLARYPTGLLPRGLPHRSDLPAPPPIGAAHPPVVLVHGLADNRSIFAALRRGLARAGFTDVHAFDHNPVGGDVRGKAELLGRHIERVCERAGVEGVYVIGHSLGGLIARCQVQCLGGDVRVPTVVTLGTPHGGTRTARLLSAHPLVRQMCPDSPLIAELSGPAPHCRTRFITFRGDLDPFVIPARSGAIDHPDLDTIDVLVAGAGHVALTANRVVVDAVIGRLVETVRGRSGNATTDGSAVEHITHEAA